MSCLDYRRALLAGEPETDAMRAHRLACTGCDGFSREHQAFERDLRRALEVPVPLGFGQRLASSVSPAPEPATLPHPDRRRFLAAAASVAVASGAGLYFWLDRDDPLALACISFVMREEAKSIMMGAMPRDEAARAFGGTLPLERLERIGQIRHVAPCPFNGGTAYHVVLAVPQDKVTLLVMPGTHVAARSRALREGLHAAVVPLAGGAVGIVASSRAVVAAVTGAVRPDA